MRRLAIWAFCATSALIVAQQGQNFVRLRGERGEFVVQNWSEGSVSLLGPGALKLIGNPVQIFWKDMGFSAAANSITGETGVDETSGDYYLKAAKMAGNASLLLDSDDAYSYLVQRAQAAGQTPPPPTGDKTRMSFASPEIDYSGSATVGNLTLPGAFVGLFAMRGTTPVVKDRQTLSRVFTDNVELRGISGTVEFLLGTPAGSLPWRKATFMGPVIFKLNRASTLDGKPELPTVVNGRADRIDIDFVSPEHTIVFTGNVQVDGEMAGYSGSSAGGKAVLVFGEHNELKQIRMEGAPTVTNLKPQKPGSGGR